MITKKKEIQQPKIPRRIKEKKETNKLEELKEEDNVLFLSKVRFVLILFVLMTINKQQIEKIYF